MELDSPWLFPEKTHCSVGQMGRMCPQEERYPQEERCHCRRGVPRRRSVLSDPMVSRDLCLMCSPESAATELVFLHLQFTLFQPSSGCFTIKTAASPSVLLQPGHFRGKDVSLAQDLGQALTPESVLWENSTQKMCFFLEALGWCLCSCAAPDPAEI